MSSLFIVLLQLPSLLILAACASNSGMVDPSSVMTDTAEKSVAYQPSALPMPLRLAFMSGHVNAGITLYHAGEAEYFLIPLVKRPHRLIERGQQGLTLVIFLSLPFSIISNC